MKQILKTKEFPGNNLAGLIIYYSVVTQTKGQEHEIKNQKKNPMNGVIFVQKLRRYLQFLEVKDIYVM